MSQKDNVESGHANQPESKSVITPAGPMPKDNVHPVGPDEEVLRKKDGSLEVVPKDTDRRDHD